MAASPINWHEEVVVDSPIKVNMHYYGTEAEQANEHQANTSIVRHGFLVGEQGYLLAQNTYAEVISRPAICAIPGTPSGFLGFINHRGDTIPVFYIPGFEDSQAPIQGRWIVVIDQGSKRSGFLLSAPPERLREDWLKEPEELQLSEELTPCLGKSYRRGLQLWTEFDHQRFCLLVREQFKQN